MKLVIDGVPPWDGEYEFDSFTNMKAREANQIKVICGVRAGELLEALGAGDAAAWAAFAVMILARYGKTADPDAFMDAPVDAIDLKVNESGDADPPTQPQSNAVSSENDDSSGPDSTSTSD